MKIIKRGIVPEVPKPRDLIGECNECGTVIEVREDEEGVHKDYYGADAWMIHCPVCEMVMWTYEKVEHGSKD